MSDAINPSHYKNGYSNGAEVIDITENLNFNRGNAVKYISRAGKKPGEDELKDLQKAKWYVEREISRVERQSDRPTVRIVDAKINLAPNVSVHGPFGHTLAYYSALAKTPKASA